ncbi:hypothetical protein ACFO4P_06220 [Epilithonimonas pallida]|uniref:SMODS-associated NUDIX domain-containing protein n=1 Tax=Epilithonimonas pallida TaxID=373671 RepID=A0ABY1R928_9FLAO|nr:hypothetical protein [Epilithonimonas pallida]SMP96487.1 hypothetical protein SAMN05421679_10959 [Epilithonimonas pallida]
MTTNNLDLNFWVDIAQIATMLLTLVGLIISFWLSREALKEVRRDRVIGQRPFLLFDYGGHQSRIELKKYNDGKEYASFFWPKLESGGIHVPTVGKLRNLGTGPAVDVRLQWIIEEIYIKGEKFKIDDTKRKEPQYSPENNQNPIRESHIFPNQETGYHLLPRFISHDFNRKIERADGHFIIHYQDTFNNKHQTFQKFHAFPDYEKMTFHTTFGDLIKNENDYR